MKKLICLTMALLLCGAGKLVTRGHSHNDYDRKRPLNEALDCGFCSVEADIYLVEGKLLVAHNIWDVRPEKTLEAMYLAPLMKRVKANGGRVYAGGPTVTLLIDLKNDGAKTYAVLREELKKYQAMLTRYADGKVVQGAVTVILSGDRPVSVLAKETERLAFIDGRLGDLDRNPPATLVPLVSENFTAAFKWRGQGAMPADQMARLKAYADKAHAQGRRIRFWAIPDGPAGWEAMWDAGVDLINTDKLAQLRDWLAKKD